MSGRVIQGLFVGGRPRPVAQARAVAQRAVRPGPPPIAFAGRPPLVHQAAQVAQPFGGGDSFEIDPAQIGLGRGGGQPLPQAVLAKMEAAFGADFSGVRVHVGPQAARIGAVAFTMGDDLYFAPGKFQPESAQGQQLIGHELAHVIQQRQGRVRSPGSGIAVVQDRALEAEADRLGMRAASHIAPRGATVQAKRASDARGVAHAHVGAPQRMADGSFRVSAGTGGSIGSVRLHARAGAVAELTDLAVAEPYRDRGVGQQLIASAAQAGLQSGKSRMVLSAQDNGSNRLVQWYRGMGFQQTGVDSRGHPRLEAPIGRLLGRVAQRASSSRDTPLKELSQDGAFALPKDVILNVFEMLMRGGSSARDVARLRSVNKAAKAYIDARHVNPRNWIVLHRLKGGSFGGMLADMQVGEGPRTEFERTNAKYNPRAFGDPSVAHFWAKNLDWLETVTRADSGMDRVTLTDIPLTRFNLVRQSEEAYSRKFSAYARELAFLLIGGYEVTGASPNYKMFYMARLRVPSRGYLAALKKNDLHLRNILRGNIGGMTGVDEALVAFADFAFPMGKADLEAAQRSIASAGDVEARQKQAVKEYYGANRAAAGKADPTQWPERYLRAVVDDMRTKSGIRGFVSSAELKTYRVLLSQWFPKGAGL